MTCPICLCAISAADAQFTRCMHAVHKGCMRRILAFYGEDYPCPVCRTPSIEEILDEEDVEPPPRRQPVRVVKRVRVEESRA